MGILSKGSGRIAPERFKIWTMCPGGRFTFVENSMLKVFSSPTSALVCLMKVDEKPATFPGAKFPVALCISDRLILIPEDSIKIGEDSCLELGLVTLKENE